MGRCQVGECTLAEAKRAGLGQGAAAVVPRARLTPSAPGLLGMMVLEPSGAAWPTSAATSHTQVVLAPGAGGVVKDRTAEEVAGSLAPAAPSMTWRRAGGSPATPPQMTHSMLWWRVSRKGLNLLHIPALCVVWPLGMYPRGASVQGSMERSSHPLIPARASPEPLCIIAQWRCSVDGLPVVGWGRCLSPGWRWPAGQVVPSTSFHFQVSTPPAADLLKQSCPGTAWGLGLGPRPCSPPGNLNERSVL